MRDKILIVEDDGMIAMLLEDILDALDREVSACVSSVDQALAYLEDHRPDAAIVDLRLGDEVSYPIMDRLRELGRTICRRRGGPEDPAVLDRNRGRED